MEAKVSQHKLNAYLLDVVIWFAVISDFSVIDLFTWHSTLLVSIPVVSPQSPRTRSDPLLMV